MELRHCEDAEREILSGLASLSGMAPAEVPLCDGPKIKGRSSVTSSLRAEPHGAGCGLHPTGLQGEGSSERGGASQQEELGGLPEEAAF